MNLDNFVKNFAAQFEDADPDTISANTPFRDITGWSSLAALSVIAMVDEEYSVKVAGNDIRNSVTISDLYEIVKSRV